MAMTKVTVIAPQGARIVGPAVISITKDQHARRIGVLGGTAAKGGKYKLDGGQSVTFKHGETLKVEKPGGRLSKSLFDFRDPVEDETGDEPSDGEQAELPAEGDGSGDDKVDEETGS